MKSFQLMPGIIEYKHFMDFAKSLHIGARDLILTNEYIYNPTIAVLNLGCQTCFQEKYGAGEPTDVMVDAILNDLRPVSYTHLDVYKRQLLFLSHRIWRMHSIRIRKSWKRPFGA